MRKDTERNIQFYHSHMPVAYLKPFLQGAQSSPCCTNNQLTHSLTQCLGYLLQFILPTGQALAVADTIFQFHYVQYFHVVHGSCHDLSQLIDFNGVVLTTEWFMLSYQTFFTEVSPLQLEYLHVSLFKVIFFIQGQGSGNVSMCLIDVHKYRGCKQFVFII